MALAKPTFIAAGANRHPSAADWDDSGTVLAFGTGHNIGLWRPTSDDNRGIETLLSGHTDAVNVVKFMPFNALHASILLSGSADGTLRIWTTNIASPGEYKQMVVLEEHRKSINCIAVLPEANTFVSGAADGECRVWRIESSTNGQHVNVQCVQTLKLSPKFFPLALAIAHLPASDSIVIAVGGSRPFVQIYVSQQTVFKLVATLTGHEGWIRSLDFIRETEEGNSDLLLASASQDKYIRLWRVHEGETLPAAHEATADPLLGSVGKSLSNKAHRFETSNTKYSVTFEALLLGHEDWIFTARWKRVNHRIRLLSASADNSLAIWELDVISGVWICTVRLGEISAQKGATTATGSTGGFWIGLWGPQGDAVVSLGRTGSWRLWQHDASSDRWTQAVAVGGHTREVRGLAWSRDGSYLLSTSSDQTTRLFAEWKTNGRDSWHEFSRPQIHGYDLNCVDTIGNGQFISGADEKLLRVFDEPKGVADILSQLCRIERHTSKALPEAASIPVLGLSNKAIDLTEDGEDTADLSKEDASQAFSGTTKNNLDLRQPPIEDQLARHLLWPETEKLYGHGYEITAVAASNNGTIVATACRASSIDHAVIRLYETSGWREVKPTLTAHSLTVTSLQFSPDDRYLLSVGRDRQCAIFERGTSNATEYSMIVSNPKAHTRMLLDASWAPSDAGYVFATAGRDKNVHVWRLSKDELERCATISASLPVTATAFYQLTVDGSLVLAYGLENGSIYVVEISIETLQLRGEPRALAGELTPSSSITKLAWRPQPSTPHLDDTIGVKDQTASRCQLAVASEDCSVRIFDMTLR